MPAFRAYRHQLGRETISLNDAVGALAVLEPQLFEFETLACDVETGGELTRGVLVVDRRDQCEWRPNVNVAVGVDAGRARQYIVDQLAISGNRPR